MKAVTLFLGIALLLAGVDTAAAQTASSAPSSATNNPLSAIATSGSMDNLPPVNFAGIDYSNQPDPQVAPALAPFRERGAKFHYMGFAGGLHGWFMTLPDNFIQIAYTSPDSRQLIIGFVVDETGRNLTEQQMVNLRERDPEVNKLFTDKVADAQARLARDRGFQELMTNLNLDRPGDKLYAEMTQAPSIQVGREDAPLLLMVIDPQCPFCKTAWRKLADDFIDEGKLLVRLIPVAILGESSMKMAELLLDTDGKQRWEAYAKADFDPKALSGEAGEDGKRRYAVNAAFYNRWKLQGTPFFAYRAKDGGIKVLNELPKDWNKLVADIAPAQAVTLPR